MSLIAIYHTNPKGLERFQNLIYDVICLQPFFNTVSLSSHFLVGIMI